MPKVAKKPSQPQLVYPSIDVRICTGEDALTAALARSILGWEPESNGVKFGDVYTVTDENGDKVRCTNNTRNRPLNEEWSRALAQDILNKRWRCNLETIIVGKYGQVLSGQHRLIALILAVQIWENDQNGFWREKWDSEPTIETLVAFGGEESDEFTQTLDNVRPRTLGDILFTSGLYQQHRNKDRKTLVRAVDYAVRLLWIRTGVMNSEFVSRKTHSESLDFIKRHPRIVECVKTVYDEDHNGSISKFISLGYAAGLMYLMAASGDSRDLYLDGIPSENAIMMDRRDDALLFWTEFSQGKLSYLKSRLGKAGPDDERTITVHEQLALVVKAWNAYIAGQDIDADVLTLHYENEVLAEYPTLGGIDAGPTGQTEEDDA